LSRRPAAPDRSDPIDVVDKRLLINDCREVGNLAQHVVVGIPLIANRSTDARREWRLIF